MQSFNTLPDGVYVIKYSVAPNEYVYVEYNHLRITNALIKYNELLCELDVAACNPLQEVQDKLQELRLIRMLLDAAKAKVEFCPFRKCIRRFIINPSNILDSEFYHLIVY